MSDPPIRVRRLGADEARDLLMQYCSARDTHPKSKRTLALRNRLIEHHLPLVYSVRRRSFQRIPHEDVAALGTMALIEALERFDPSRGGAFSTYAIWRIRYVLGRTFQNEHSLVRVPVHAQDPRSRSPLRADAEAARKMRSLDVRVHSEDGRDTFGDMLSAGEESVLDKLADTQECEALTRALSSLTPSQRRVLELRTAGATIREVEAQLGLGREAVLKLHSQALGTLRRALAA